MLTMGYQEVLHVKLAWTPLVFRGHSPGMPSERGGSLPPPPCCYAIEAVANFPEMEGRSQPQRATKSLPVYSSFFNVD